jgi:hypothetical protein
LIGLEIVWLIGVGFRWEIVCLRWNIGILKHPRSGILRHPFTQKKQCHECEDDERGNDLTEENIRGKRFPDGVRAYERNQTRVGVSEV